MSDWLCWHVGTVTDPKLTSIVKRSNVSRPVVIAFWAYLLERGRVSDTPGMLGIIDCEDASLAIDAPIDQVEAVLTAMRAKGMIENDHIANWQKRQHKTSTERVRAHRDRDKKQDPVTGNVSSFQKQPGNAETDVQTDRQTDRQSIEIKNYRFAGSVIKLLSKDYDSWKEQFNSILDFDAELRRCDDAVRDNPKWFPAVSAMLNAKHQANLKNAPKSRSRGL